MSQHDDAVRLRHMLDHAREAVAALKDRPRADLDDDRLLELALLKLVEIIGEAASRVSDAKRAECPGIPWPQVVGMRNKLVHGYDEVELAVLWDTVKDDLPPLIAELEKVLA